MKLAKPNQRGFRRNGEAEQLRILRRMFKFFVLLTAVLGLPSAFLAAMSLAQTSAPLPVRSVLEARSFAPLSTIEFSRDSNWLAYVVQDQTKTASRMEGSTRKTHIPSWAEGNGVYLLNLATRESRNLTGGEGESWLPSWSPDGRYLAFLSSRDGSGEARLWVWDRTTNQIREACDKRISANQIEWMPDSRRVILTILQDSRRDCGEGKTVQLPPGGEANHANPAKLSTVRVYESHASAKGEPVSPADPWNLAVSPVNLVIVDVVSGEVSSVVENRRIAAYKVSSDGSQIAFSTPKRFEEPGSQQILFDLAEVTLASHRVNILASNIRLDYDGAEFNWSPQARFVAFHTGGPSEAIRDCYVAPVAGGPPRNLTNFRSKDENDHWISSVPLWDGTGHVYFIRNGALWRASVDEGPAVVGRIAGHTIERLLEAPDAGRLWIEDGDRSTTVLVARDHLRKQDGFYRMGLADGLNSRFEERGQCYTCQNMLGPIAVAKDGRSLAYVSEDAQHAPDLWMSDHSFREALKLTDLNPEFHSYRMGEARLIHWLSDDGQELSGALLLPSGFHDGTRYPLVVWVYGGSTLSDNLLRFGLGGAGPFNFQLLATRGYAVLLPDSPRSKGDPMLQLEKTILPGVNRVIEMGIADPGRLGVMGVSNGGYSTLALMVETNRFKAAVEMDGMANLMGLYGEMDETGAAFGTSLEHMFDVMGGTPWEYRERYIENSPIFYLDRIRTPLLIIHGDRDRVVIPSLGDEIFVGLRRLGREVEYAKYTGEGHSQLDWNRTNQEDVCNRMINWFERHLK